MADFMSFDGIPNDIFNFFDDIALENIELGSEKDIELGSDKDIELVSETDNWNEMQFDPNMDIPLGFSSGLYGALQNDSPKENKNLSLPYNETCRPNLFQSPAETTSSGGSTLPSEDSSTYVKPMHLFKTSSPVSILESSNSCFAENPKTSNPKIANPPKRARTKRSRSRPSSIDRLCTLSFISTTTPEASDSSHPSVNSKLDGSTLKPGKSIKPVKRVVRKERLILPKPAWLETRELLPPLPQQLEEPKRCSHCEVTSTPQWREGPMGPKTLCNACGVRYRSGRLYPEYRPAASPTFVPAVHSNSHKKVVEMRNKSSLVSDSISARAGVKLYFRPQAGNSVKQLIV